MKKILTLTGLLFLFSAKIFAYDFIVDGIYYTADSDSTVFVTNSGSYNSYSGTVTVPETVSYNDTLYTVTAIGGSAFRECTALDTVNIPTTVTAIRGYAFYQSAIKIFEMTDSVTTLGDRAFCACYYMTSIYISNNITELPYLVFSFTGLDSVVIPNSVTQLDEKIFSNSDVRYVKLPDFITEIPTSTFKFCTKLESIVIPESVTYIGNIAFLGCESLADIKMPSSVTSVGQNAFYQCYTFTTGVVISDSLTEIPSGMFGYCYNLDSVIIPAAVTKVGSYAFMDCSGITTIQCNATTPPECGTNPFIPDSVPNITLYVPYESVELYKAADVWKDFYIVGMQTVTNEITETVCDSYEFAGETITQSGIYYDTITVSRAKDSVVILSLTVNKGYEIELSETIPYGSEYVLGTQTLTEGGTYSETFTTVTGCDSIITLSLIIAENNVPVITTDSNYFEVPAGCETGYVVTTVTATDAEDASLTYSLSFASVAFDIDSESGEITVENPDFLVAGETYSLVVNVSDGTDVATTTISVSVTSVAEEPGTGTADNLFQSIRIYPTPAEDVFHIETGFETAYVTITTSKGCVVYNKKIEKNTTINCSDFAAGIYFVHIKSDTKSVTKQVPIR